jgi:hypothetical protein
LIFDIPGSYRCHLAKCPGGYDDLEWWNWCHDEEVIKPNRENVMARRKVVEVEEVNETEVNEEEVEEVEEVNKIKNTFVLKQKTKYQEHDSKAYAFKVELDFTGVEIRELYKYSAKAIVIAARPKWKEDKVLEDFEKRGLVKFPVREFLDRSRTRGPAVITAESLSKQMQIPLETAEMVMRAMRNNPQSLQEQLVAITEK